MNQKPNKPRPDTKLVVGEPAELMAFLLEQLPNKNRFLVKSLLRDRRVFIDNQPVSQYNHPLQPGQEVVIRWETTAAEKQYRGLSIVFEDNDLIVIHKQAGLLSIATDKQKMQTAYSILSSHVKSQHPSNRIFVVHRLDRETSGLMLFAKSEKIQQLLQESWTSTIQERTYLAVIEGILAEPAGTVTSYLHESKALMVYSNQKAYGGQKAITHYQTLRQTDRYSLLKVNLETGRKNQIRVHMQDLGHPIVGDAKYGATQDPLGRLGLHAWVLAFTHPRTGEAMRFETAIPGGFQKLFGTRPPQTRM